MPLWRVFCTEGTYTSSEKQALSSAITKIYTTTSPARLPAFYVNVIFVESRPGNCFVGGTSQDHFVRFAGEHIARHMSPDEIARMHRFMDWLSQALKPFTNDKGLTWEAHIDQTPRELWRVGGLAPPPADSEAEALWRKMNAPVPYDHEGITPTYVGEKVNGTAVNGMMLARA